MSDPWGRVADDGTVFVRTADGERAVGSWLAGPPAAGLAHFERKFADLEVEVILLEQRVKSGGGDAKAALASAQRLVETIPTAAVVGDLVSLEARAAKVLAMAEEHAAKAAEASAAARAAATERKEALVAEAEKLATSSEWKAAGDRLRAIPGELKGIRGGDRKADEELRKRVNVARKAFDSRREAHFAALTEQRETSKARKEALIAQAEAVAAGADSPTVDWVAGAKQLADLMASWKKAGRAARGDEDALWARFKAAQDVFFGKRSEVYAERDAGLRSNQEVKEQLLVEAEAIDVSDPSQLDAAQRKLRDISERWAAAGKVPREAMKGLEARLEAVEAKVRAASDARWRRTNPSTSPLVIRLEESITKLERKLEQARAAGDERKAAEHEAALATQREWLAQAERS